MSEVVNKVVFPIYQFRVLPEVILLASMSMETTSSTVSALRPFVDDKISLLTLVVVLQDQISIGTVFKILFRRIDFGISFIVFMGRTILATFVSDATSSTMVVCTLNSPTTWTRSLVSLPSGSPSFF